MYRTAINSLQKWLTTRNRKPLVIRGARQVGKTWLVRELAQANKKQLIEVNFESDPSYASLFKSNDPTEILLALETHFNTDINPLSAILFLDEIQAYPEVLAKLRWFYEKMPTLPVIAAGSLLEFVLEKHTFSMPVGRINYLHLEPLSFEEFLIACNRARLKDYLDKYNWNITIPTVIHDQLITLFKEYLIIGGMPAAVSTWIDSNSLRTVNAEHFNLMSTYQDDFNKYAGRLPIENLEAVLQAVPKYLNQKFIYSKVSQTASSQSIKQALRLLTKARICHKVLASAGNGLPLAAEVKERYLKIILLDVGLVSASLGLNLNNINNISDINLINKGSLSEQVVGQILRTLPDTYIEPSLYYWVREEKGSMAEIDYLIQHKNKLVPIEVKSGSTGSLKSLHLFMAAKKYEQALRINSDYPSKMTVDVKTPNGLHANYQLVSLPFYLLGQLNRLLD